MQLEYTLTEQIKHYKDSRKFENDRRERSQRMSQIEMMLDNFNNERKGQTLQPEILYGNAETPNTVKTDQNSSICKEGTVDMKRK